MTKDNNKIKHPTSDYPEQRDRAPAGRSLHGSAVRLPPLPESTPTEAKNKVSGDPARSVSLGLSTLETSDTLICPRNPLKTRISRMKRVVSAAAHAIQGSMTSKKCRFRVAFITLTYRVGEQWEPYDITHTIKCYRQWLKRRNIELHGVWVAELQKRGAVHYHLLLWLPKGITPPKPDKKGWWKKGSTNCKWARKPVNYIMKYASKAESKNGGFPKGCRLFGVYGVPINLSWWRVPGWMRDIAEPGDTIKRRGPWLVHYESGYGFKTPWVVENFNAISIELRWRGFSEFRMETILDIEDNWMEWADVEAAHRTVRRDDKWMGQLERMPIPGVRACPISHETASGFGSIEPAADGGGSLPIRVGSLTRYHQGLPPLDPAEIKQSCADQRRGSRPWAHESGAAAPKPPQAITAGGSQ